MRSPWLLLTLLCACPSPAPPKPVGFPPSFLWGVSTAAEQSEGGNTQNDWYAFEGMGRVPPVGMADDMYDRFDTDFANAQSIGANAFRLTFEWARFMPQAPADPANPTEADLDPGALAHYQAVVASLKVHGLTPIVTLTHYTLPTWIDNPAAYDGGSNSFTDGTPGGWLSPITVTAFAGYAGLMAKEFGADVTYWLTENEPDNVDVIWGYMVGLYPPGLDDFSLTKTSLPGDAGVADVERNLIAGHAAAYKAIHAVEPNAKVSLAHNSIDFEPITQSPADVALKQRIEFLWDYLYLDAVTTGAFDTSLVGQGPLEQHPEWAHTLDFLGVNYYSHDFAVSAPGLLPPLEALPCDYVLEDALPGVLQGLGCPPATPYEPAGLTDLLLKFQQRYDLPILITENGANLGVGDPNKAETKAAYLVSNLLALHAAIAQGITVLGYSYWTLNDDYEWVSGYTDCEGLFSVAGFSAGPDGGLPMGPDGGPWAPGATTDFTRVPYAAATAVYAAIADAGLIPQSLIDQYAPDGG